MSEKSAHGNGYIEVFCKYITRSDGTRIYPKNAKCFHFFMKKK